LRLPDIFQSLIAITVSVRVGLWCFDGGEHWHYGLGCDAVQLARWLATKFSVYTCWPLD